MTPSEKARETLLKKLGSEEALHEYYQDLQKKSRLHPNNKKGQHRGGFNDRQFAKEMSEKGIRARGFRKD